MPYYRTEPQLLLHLRAYVVRVLYRNSKGFAEYSTHPALQNIRRQPLEEDYITPQLPVDTPTARLRTGAGIK